MDSMLYWQYYFFLYVFLSPQNGASPREKATRSVPAAWEFGVRITTLHSKHNGFRRISQGLGTRLITWNYHDKEKWTCHLVFEILVVYQVQWPVKQKSTEQTWQKYRKSMKLQENINVSSGGIAQPSILYLAFGKYLKRNGNTKGRMSSIYRF